MVRAAVHNVAMANAVLSATKHCERDARGEAWVRANDARRQPAGAGEGHGRLFRGRLEIICLEASLKPR
jgi:hypothetical protein